MQQHLRYSGNVFNMIGPLAANEFLNIYSEAGGTTVIFDASDILVTLFATSEHMVIALHIQR